MLWVTLIGLVIALGLGSRRFAAQLPDFVAAYASDTLWATAAFLGLGLAQRAAPTWLVALQALLLSMLIEVSQCYHAPWIDSIRHTKIGGLILGHGFLWSDLACYAAGVALRILIERVTLVGRTHTEK
jgi:hypothetical protein